MKRGPLIKHLLFIAVLLPQYAFLSWVAYLSIAYANRDCLGGPYSPFEGLFVLLRVLGIFSIMGLCGLRYRFIWLYLTFALPAQMLCIAPIFADSYVNSFIPICLLFLMMTTLAFCFVPGLYLFDQTPPGVPLPGKLRPRWYLPNRWI